MKKSLKKQIQDYEYENIKLLVCGGRDYDNEKLVNEILNFIHQECKIKKLIQGDAKGADYLAKRWAIDNKIKRKDCPADWNKHGKAAGPIRNLQMLREETPDVVLAFPGGNGTTHMVAISKTAKLPVWIVKE